MILRAHVLWGGLEMRKVRFSRARGHWADTGERCRRHRPTYTTLEGARPYTTSYWPRCAAFTVLGRAPLSSQAVCARLDRLDILHTARRVSSSKLATIAMITVCSCRTCALGWPTQVHGAVVAVGIRVRPPARRRASLLLTTHIQAVHTSCGTAELTPH